MKTPEFRITFGEAFRSTAFVYDQGKIIFYNGANQSVAITESVMCDYIEDLVARELLKVNNK